MKKIVYANKDIKVKVSFYTMTIKKGVNYEVTRVGSEDIKLTGDDNSYIYVDVVSFDKLVEKGELKWKHST